MFPSFSRRPANPWAREGKKEETLEMRFFTQQIFHIVWKTISRIKVKSFSFFLRILRDQYYVVKKHHK